MQNRGAEMKIRAERRLGELLAEIPREQGKRTDLTSVHDDLKSDYEATLVREDIKPSVATRWQSIERIPQPVFERKTAS